MKHYLTGFFISKEEDAGARLKIRDAFVPEKVLPQNFTQPEQGKPLVGVNVGRVMTRLEEAHQSAITRKLLLENEIERLKIELYNTERAGIAYEVALRSLRADQADPEIVGSDAEWLSSLASIRGDDTTVEEDTVAYMNAESVRLSEEEANFKAKQSQLDARAAQVFSDDFDEKEAAAELERTNAVSRDYKPLTVGKIEVDFHPVTGAMSSKVVHP